MKYGKAVVAVVIFLSACATTANYEKILNTWVGGNVDSLVSSWGPPANFYTFSDGGRVLEYSNQRNIQIGGYTTTTPQTTYQTGSVNVGSVYGNYNSTSTTYVRQTTPVQNISMQCVTRFTVNPQGIITKWAWQGNACKAMASDVSDEKVSDEDVSVTPDSHANAPLTEYEIAQSKYKAKDFVGAFAIYKRLAEAGNTEAEKEVGKMYYSGQGTARDPVQAFYWWKKLADNGNKIAQQRIAIMYEMGDGVEKNQSEADAWHKRAKAGIDVDFQPALKQSLIEGLSSTGE